MSNLSKSLTARDLNEARTQRPISSGQQDRYGTTALQVDKDADRKYDETSASYAREQSILGTAFYVVRSTSRSLVQTR